MENPSFEDDLEILPARLSPITAAYVPAQRKVKESKINYWVYFTFMMMGVGSFRVSNIFYFANFLMNKIFIARCLNIGRPSNSCVW